jgi:phage terminase Nu1 subunit (DNA packaging protein)
VPDVTGGDKGEAAVTDGDKDEAAVADEPPVAQGSGAGYAVAWNFKGAWVATITRECANRGKTIEMEVKKLTKKKLETARDAKAYDYDWVRITDEQRKQAALDYLDVVVPSLLL